MLFALLLAAAVCKLPPPDAHGCVSVREATAVLTNPECKKTPLPRCFSASIAILDAHGHEIDGDWGRCPLLPPKRVIRVDVTGGGADWKKRAEKACATVLAQDKSGNTECRAGERTEAAGPMKFKLVVEVE